MVKEFGLSIVVVRLKRLLPGLDELGHIPESCLGTTFPEGVVNDEHSSMF